MMANEGVVDAFGHVSMRHPTDPGRYLLSRSRSPALIEAGDILEFTLDSEPVAPATVGLYAERVIHGCIYQARPDVMAVCHHHAPAVMPCCIAGVPLVPVFHVAAVMGETVPFWDQRDEFGDSNLLVVTPEEGRSLARALGPHSAVLMRRDRAGGESRALNALATGLPTAVIDIILSPCRGRSGGDRSGGRSGFRATPRRTIRSLADAGKKAHGVSMIAGQEAAR